MSRNPSNPRTPFRRPTILIGTDATLLGRPQISPVQAADAGLYGLDLDLRSAWRSPAAGDFDDHQTTRIRSIWLPAQYTGLVSEQRASRLGDFLTSAATNHGLRTVILPRASAPRQQGVQLSRLARQKADLTGVRIALRVGAEALLARSGPHLEHVANMRRVAEEWDMDIALDLTGRGIERWEAEAALLRLFPRLVLVRIRPATAGRELDAASPQAKTCLRTIRMLADQGYSGVISIAPEPSVPAWMSSLYAPDINSVQSMRAEILAAYDRVDQYDVTTRQSHQWNP